MGYIGRRMLKMEPPGRRKKGRPKRRLMNVVKDDMQMVTSSLSATPSSLNFSINIRKANKASVVLFLSMKPYCTVEMVTSSLSLASTTLSHNFMCVNAGMDTLTLARFVCELSLLEMQFVPVRASLLASACLLIALVTKDLGGWMRPSEFSALRELHSYHALPTQELSQDISAQQ
ncbi:G2/mitotic-specific cyclin-B3 [Silurus meridionalis]|nr:G2/mitotic-specific cyclin-B3 [Silurus meridionalis]